jgi:hypothetical protein
VRKRREGVGGPQVRNDGSGLWTTDREGPDGYKPVLLHWSCRPSKEMPGWSRRAEPAPEPLLFKLECPLTLRRRSPQQLGAGGGTQ